MKAWCGSSQRMRQSAFQPAAIERLNIGMDISEAVIDGGTSNWVARTRLLVKSRAVMKIVERRCNQTVTIALNAKRLWSVEMFHYKTLIVLAAGMIAVMASADAQTNRHRRHPPVVEQYNNERPPLTVNKRSFLDPGPVVPIGSMSNYATTITVFGKTPDQNFAYSEFGNEVLPGPLSVPGRPSPILEFATPPYPD
jgi:hypothetical protein